jgi:hypothetical protein
MPVKPTPLDTRFWSRVDIREPDECWPWLLSRHTTGHGRFKVEGTMVFASRVAFYSCHGYWPDHANHLSPECNNPWCCNPLHLYDGDKADNSLDMWVAGRARPAPPRGEANYRATVTDEVALAIYKRYWRDGRTRKEIADEFGASPSTVGNIASGHTWGWLTGHKPGAKPPKKGA